MRKMLVVLCIILLLLPATNAQDITTVAGASTSITLAAPEDAAEPLTFIIDALPVNGVLTGEAPNFVYQPNAGFVGTALPVVKYHCNCCSSKWCCAG